MRTTTAADAATAPAATAEADAVAPAQRVRVAGVTFDNVTLDEALTHVAALARCGRPAFVVTPNVDHVVRARRDAGYRDLIAQADLVLADGQPIVWGSRLLGRPLKQRVAGSDLFPQMCARAARECLKVFFLGGNPGAAEGARRVLEERCPGLQVCGTHCPPYGFEADPAARAAALDAVRAAQPNVLFVGLGSPKQEQWIVTNMAALGPLVSIGVGISFSFISGDVKRAPRWAQRLGLEWLHRLISEPGRLWKRYLVQSWGFVPALLGDAWAAPREARSPRAGESE